MFGLFRLSLAQLVVVSHLYTGAGQWHGPYAVFAFYLLSGYLMTAGLCEVYGFGVRGIGEFWANRLLRIFPMYLVVLILSGAALWLWPEQARQLGSVYRLPEAVVDWWRNLTLVDLRNTKAFIVPAAWSLELEWIFYLAMPLFLSRTRWIVWVWFASSLSYTVLLLYTDAPFNVRYYSVFAVALPFSIGALLSYYRDQLPRLPSVLGLVVALLFVGHSAFADRLWTNPYREGLYVSLLLACVALWGLAAAKLGKTSLLRRLDQISGGISYPIFLAQWLLALLMVSLGWATPNEADGNLLWRTLPALYLFGFVLYLSVDAPIEKWRHRRRIEKLSQTNAETPPR